MDGDCLPRHLRASGTLQQALHALRTGSWKYIEGSCPDYSLAGSWSVLSRSVVSSSSIAYYRYIHLDLELSIYIYIYIHICIHICIATLTYFQPAL